LNVVNSVQKVRVISIKLQFFKCEVDSSITRSTGNRVCIFLHPVIKINIVASSDTLNYMFTCEFIGM